MKDNNGIRIAISLVIQLNNSQIMMTFHDLYESDLTAEKELNNV